jgi:caa(3)-type oxidase subunit IV
LPRNSLKAWNDPTFCREVLYNNYVVSALMPLFGILLAMPAAAVLVGFMVTGPYKVWISLTLSVVQASTLAWFYMDLKNGDRVTWLCVGAAIFWTAILFTITRTDYVTRHHWAH